MLNFTIAQGFWTNELKGGVRQQTLTLSHESATFLFAFIALFMGLAGSRLWVIVAYILHQVQAGSKFKKLFHHQNQVVIRNTGDPLQATVDLFHVSWAWKLTAEWSLLRSLALIVTATFFWIGAFALGLFAPRITTGYTLGGLRYALAKSTTCGLMRTNTETTEGYFNANYWLTQKHSEAKTYASTCYTKDASSSICKILPQSSITYSSNNDAPCPVAQQYCALSENSATRMDTGYLSSQVFGINSRPEDDVFFRRILTCAPLDLGSLKRRIRGSALKKADNRTLVRDQWYELLYAGPRLGEERTLPWTSEYSFRNRATLHGYSLTTMTSNMDWKPIPELRRTDGDVTLFTISANHIAYAARVDDPVFRAQERVRQQTSRRGFLPNNLTNQIACVEQASICIPGGDCTPVSGRSRLANALSDLPLNSWQNATVHRLLFSGDGISSASRYLGRSLLIASDKVASNRAISPGLPYHQWRLEAENWFDISLAYLQLRMAEVVAQPSWPHPGLSIWIPDIPGFSEQCNNQKIRIVGKAESFGVLELSLVFGIGLVVILLSLCVQSVGGGIQRLFRVDAQRRQQYRSDHYFELQRQGLEDRGLRPWSNTRHRAPRTDSDILIAKPTDRTSGRSTYKFLHGLEAMDKEQASPASESMSGSEFSQASRPNATRTYSRLSQTRNVTAADVESVA